jgi:hypothetical protein
MFVLRNEITQLMTLPRNPELKIFPLHTQTPVAKILRNWPIKPLKRVILLAADRLNLLLVFPEDEDINSLSVGVDLLLFMWLEHFTGNLVGSCHLYRNRLCFVCEALRIVREMFVKHSNFTLALRLHKTGTEAKAQRKQVIAFSSDNSNLSIDKGPPEISGLGVRST